MKKNLDPEQVPAYVASHNRGGEAPSKGSLYQYVIVAEQAMANGLHSVAEYGRKRSQIEAQRVRSLELWYRRELGCKS